jgi:hypothetical protein
MSLNFSFELRDKLVIGMDELGRLVGLVGRGCGMYGDE